MEGPLASKIVTKFQSNGAKLRVSSLAVSSLLDAATAEESAPAALLEYVNAEFGGSFVSVLNDADCETDMSDTVVVWASGAATMQFTPRAVAPKDMQRFKGGTYELPLVRGTVVHMEGEAFQKLYFHRVVRAPAPAGDLPPSFTFRRRARGV